MPDSADQLTGLDRDNPQAGGRGGRQRMAAIDANVDAMQRGKPTPNPTVVNNPGQDHPAAVKPKYVPTEQEKATRTYGSPIEGPPK